MLALQKVQTAIEVCRIIQMALENKSENSPTVELLEQTVIVFRIMESELTKRVITERKLEREHGG